MEDSKEEDSREMMGGGQQGGDQWYNRARNAEYQEQQRLLDMFKQREEAKKEE